MRVERVVTEAIARRQAGELVSDARVIADHPELSPDLATALRTAADVRRAYMVARRSGSAAGNAIEVLSDDELDAPIGEPAAEAVAAVVPMAQGYDIESQLPGGAQAVVYLARQVKTGRRVVVKVLTDGRYAHPRLRQRFEQEAEVLAALDHPHLVSVIDTGHTEDDAPFLVMPYVDGRQLDEYWGAPVADGGIGGGEAGPILALFEKLSRAVHAAHLAGVIHRDLKPSNIRIDRHGEPRVLDFGMARLVSAIDGTVAGLSARTLTGERVVGTPAWMSPEQAAGTGNSIDCRTDVYALGVMLYHALAGRSPYPEEAPPELLLSHILGTIPLEPSRSPKARRGVDRRVDSIVLKSLAKGRDDRYPTAAALADDLALCRAGGRPLAMMNYSVLRAPRPERLGAWSWAAAAATVAVAAVVWEGFGLGLLGPGKPIYVPPGKPTTTSRPASSGFNRASKHFLSGQVSMLFVEINPSRFLHRGPGDAAVVVDHAFWIGVSEVTRSQFGQAMGLPVHSLSPDEGEMPMTNVSHAEAAEFCRTMGLSDGRRYRLPTAAEWELAARAGVNEPVGGERFGAQAIPDRVSWNLGNSGGRAHAVRKKQPNGFTLWDMNGNVAEWCDAGTPTQPKTAVYGGAYDRPPDRCTNDAFEVLAPDQRRADVGFRVVMEIDLPGPTEK